MGQPHGKPVLREGLPLVEIVAKKLPDGSVRFIAVYVEDCAAGHAGEEAVPPPRYSECSKACPVGYSIIRDPADGRWMAKPGH